MPMQAPTRRDLRRALSRPENTMTALLLAMLTGICGGNFIR